jgi:hypothetical protein
MKQRKRYHTYVMSLIFFFLLLCHTYEILDFLRERERRKKKLNFFTALRRVGACDLLIVIVFGTKMVGG